ncbi:MAG: UDP-2,3-diacylglucosamine diphosphatase [Gammaproteobacteria bacterium]|nr:UDP-2,3-diacylglucosamine diphosphatase [Gammaproteobacteria bacterium]
MAGTMLFISDLHLCDQRPAITRLFLDFLAGEARAASALYILGDLFEFWVGDDAATEDEYRPVVEGLRALSRTGVPLYFMYGNRDFLMRKRFEEITGGRLIPDPLRIELYGEPTLLMHGDLLCTADTDYMKFRAMVRDPVWQGDFLAKSLAERNTIFNNYREISKATTTKKPPEIMDVAQSTVESVMRQHNVRRLIHGHTHRPGEHVFTLDGAPTRRMVLGVWYEQGSVLRVDAKGWTLSTLPTAA